MAGLTEKKKGRQFLSRGENWALIDHGLLCQPGKQGVYDRSLRAAFKQTLVGVSASFADHAEEKLWECARQLQIRVSESTLRGEGGRYGNSPITAKSGLYALGLIDDIEKLIGGLFQASPESVMLINLARKDDTAEKCRSMYNAVGGAMRLNGKRVRFNEWEAVWKNSELGCVIVDFDQEKVIELGLHPVAYTMESAGGLRAANKV